jgi:hypothetical protein
MGGSIAHSKCSRLLVVVSMRLEPGVDAAAGTGTVEDVTEQYCTNYDFSL